MRFSAGPKVRAMRSELYRLVHDLRRYLEYQRRDLVLPGAVAASAEQRAPFDELHARWRADRAEMAVSALRSNHTAAPSRRKPSTGPADHAAARPTAKPAPVSKSDDKLWLELGSKPKSTFGDAPTPLTQRAFDANDKSLTNPAKINALHKLIGDCKRCGLCEGRTNLVFGTGNPQARLMFVGEAPTSDEDQQGKPSVGKAGELLNKMIEAMGYRRDDVYIANVIKCRPPGDRDPTPEEVRTCRQFIVQQVAAVAPEVIVTLGEFAANVLMGKDSTLTQQRGKWQVFDDIPLMPTFHPAYLLSHPHAKRGAWADLQAVMTKLNSNG